MPVQLELTAGSRRIAESSPKRLENIVHRMRVEVFGSGSSIAEVRVSFTSSKELEDLKAVKVVFRAQRMSTHLLILP